MSFYLSREVPVVTKPEPHIACKCMLPGTEGFHANACGMSDYFWGGTLTPFAPCRCDCHRSAK